MKDVVLAVLTALLGGGIGAAIIAAINERWKFKAQRKAAKEDRDAEKNDKTDALCEQFGSMQKEECVRNQELEERLKRMELQNKSLGEGVKLILLDRILQFGEYLIDKGEITYNDRKRFHEMHACYHDSLNGNGDADIIVEAVKKLPLKHGEGEGHAGHEQK